VISGETRLVGLLGDPVSGSLSPLMQNAAFAATGLDWAYVALPVEAERVEHAVRGLVALGFAGANVTAPHKITVARLVEAGGLPSVNTLVVRDGRVEGHSTDAAVLAGLEIGQAAILGSGGAAEAFAFALPHAERFSRGDRWPPNVGDCALVVNATSEREDVLVELTAGQTLVDLPYPLTATALHAKEAGARVVDGLETLVAQGAAAFELWTGLPAPVDVMRAAVRSA
jgi:shikimate dehydrogenase